MGTSKLSGRPDKNAEGRGAILMSGLMTGRPDGTFFQMGGGAD